MEFEFAGNWAWKWGFLADLIRDSVWYAASTGGYEMRSLERLDQIIDMNHPLAKLARAVDWSFLEGRFGEVYTDDSGHPPLPTRLMAGLSILKHTYDLSDQVLCERWNENPYYQRRGVLSAPAGVRSLVDDALAQPHGGGAVAGAAPGKPGGRYQD